MPACYRLDVATISVDDELLAVLPGGHPGADEQIRELAVIELYRRRIISSGKAAELLHRDRGEFIAYTSRLGIPYVDFDDVELARELDSARKLRP
jgi:predicted HTH domain antitoxin